MTKARTGELVKFEIPVSNRKFRVRCYDTKDFVSDVGSLMLSRHKAGTKRDYATAKAGAKSAFVNGDFTLFVA
jgi:hypothetical protein